MTRKNFKKSSPERLKETRRHISQYSAQNTVPGECNMKHASGFRGQINLYWQKRNAEKLRWEKLHEKTNSNK
jgi:hypothetical protein